MSTQQLIDQARDIAKMYASADTLSDEQWAVASLLRELAAELEQVEQMNVSLRSQNETLDAKLAELERLERKPLTDADLGVYISKELAEYADGAYSDLGSAKDQLAHFARTIERAHHIGEGGGHV